MKRTVVLAPFFSFVLSSSRPCFVAQTLADMGSVDVVTADFDHQLKARRPETRSDWLNKIIYIKTPPYVTNTSVARFFSHIVFSIRAARYIWRARKAYDCIYVTAPLNLAGFLAFLICRQQLKILDIVDIWPDVLPFPSATRRTLAPIFLLWKHLLLHAIKRANVLMAVSDAFLAEAMRYFHYGPENARRFYIGLPAMPVGQGAKEERLTIVYVGNIGHLYDFETLLEVLAGDDLRDRVQLFVVGDGDRRQWLLAEAEKLQISYQYFGRVFEPSELAAILRRGHIGFNGYQNTSAAFSYKSVTYFAAGLPILNSMTGDLQQLVAKRRVGVNYEQRNATSLKCALTECSITSLAEMSGNALSFFAEELDASVVRAKMGAFLREKLE